ncbi:hypothetical protein X943_001309 [Babesia divergens]|uniref:Sugar phosphate transporter domain-containing protein n=1 Tax=Babesia divergens TaxID=32595 RepID=A0AAD9LE03_BABDI|nr:hypothetical protein X943_001309 [Babesia divergens]
MDTVSTEAYIPHTVIRNGEAGSMERERLMTVSLPYDDECDTDYERSNSDSSLEIVELHDGKGGEDEEWSLIGRLKSITWKVDFLAYILIFIITNSAQPLLICLLRQKGGTPNGTYTFLIPTYLAMICVGYYPTKKSIWEESWYYPIMLSALDIVHQVIEKAGLVCCGASIYSIASSTNTMFIALFSSAILKKQISRCTWFSIFLISGSIALSGISQMDHITVTHIVGFVLVVIAAMVNALNSIISEDLLRKKKIEGPNLVSMMGMISLGIFAAWSLVFTIPQRHTLFDPNSKINPFDLSAVVMVLAMLFVSNFCRSSVYYYIIKEAGSVCCGVLKAVRIVIVVIGSHALFSYADKTQTITTSKLISSIICSLGVLMYSLEHSSSQKPKEA